MKPKKVLETEKEKMFNRKNDPYTFLFAKYLMSKNKPIVKQLYDANGFMLADSDRYLLGARR